MSNAESELWRAVISRAITDATSPLSRNKSERLEQQRARDWFTTGCSYFRHVCELADMDPDHVREHVLPLIAKADLAPARTASERVKRYEYQGRSLTIAEWAAETGIPGGVIRQRLELGWSVEHALTVPLHQKRNSITPGVGQSTFKSAGDRATRVAQDSRNLEIF
jgi:hypothetical protein